MLGHEDEIARFKKELKEDQYYDAEKKYQEMLYNLKVHLVRSGTVGTCAF